MGTYPGLINQASASHQFSPGMQSILSENYANHVEVVEGEHDATLSFYRKRGTKTHLLREITVPIGVLRALQQEVS